MTSKEYRASLFAKGVCIDCRVVKETYRQTLLRCQECSKKYATYSTNRERKIRNHLRSRSMYIDCGVNSPGTMRCSNCSKPLKEAQKVEANFRKVNNLCAQCKSPIDNTTRCCNTCRAKSALRYKENCEAVKTAVATRNYNLKQIIITQYGGCCIVCGESRLPCLEIDHINEDGAEHRTKLGIYRYGGGTRFYNRLIQLGVFPEDLQILCANCHALKHATRYEQWKQSQIS